LKPKINQISLLLKIALILAKYKQWNLKIFTIGRNNKTKPILSPKSFLNNPDGSGKPTPFFGVAWSVQRVPSLFEPFIFVSNIY
jgi:hypothetical protein